VSQELEQLAKTEIFTDLHVARSMFPIRVTFGTQTSCWVVINALLAAEAQPKSLDVAQ
jgi:hypothetical protein